MTPRLWWVETPAPGRLAVVERPRGGLWLEDDMAALRAAGVDTLACLMVEGELKELQLDAEPIAAVAAGMRFAWLPISDLSTPSDDATFIAGVEGLRDELLAGR